MRFQGYPLPPIQWVGGVEADGGFRHLHNSVPRSFEQSGLVTVGNACVDIQNDSAGRQLIKSILAHNVPITDDHCLLQGFTPGWIDAFTDDHGRRVAMNGYRGAFGGNDGGEVFSHTTPHGRLDSEA